MDDLVVRVAGSQRSSAREVLLALGELRRRQGRFDDAEALWARAEFEVEPTVGRARLRLDRGDSAQAWEMIAGLIAAVPAERRLDRASVLEVGVAVAIAAGRDDTAADMAHELGAIARAVPTEALHAAAAAAAARVGDGPTRLRSWGDAVQHASRAGLRFDEADYRLEWAEALAAEGSAQAAKEQGRRAAELLVSLPESPAYRRARHLAGGDESLLTARQQEVLRLLARGLSNTQIAHALGVSPHTVHRHVANIFATLDVTSRAAAAAYAALNGLV